MTENTTGRIFRTMTEPAKAVMAATKDVEGRVLHRIDDFRFLLTRRAGDGIDIYTVGGTWCEHGGVTDYVEPS